jgi:hypothetical protein
MSVSTAMVLRSGRIVAAHPPSEDKWDSAETMMNAACDELATARSIPENIPAALNAVCATLVYIRASCIDSLRGSQANFHRIANLLNKWKDASKDFTPQMLYKDFEGEGIPLMNTEIDLIDALWEVVPEQTNENLAEAYLSAALGGLRWARRSQRLW